MATTTSNYGWSVPTSTDLVKDGATAIATLGSAIDTSMNTALGTKKAGLVLLNTTTFSAVTSQSINDVFSTTYDNYQIKINYTNSAIGSLRMRLRVSSTDASGSDYTTNGIVPYNISGSSTSTLNIAEYSQTSFYASDFGGTFPDTVSAIIEVDEPFKTDKTIIFTRNLRTNQTFNGINAGFHNLATSYTGFTLIPSAGNITGSVSVYGYNK